MGSAIRAEAGNAMVRQGPILSMVQGDRELDLVKRRRISIGSVPVRRMCLKISCTGRTSIIRSKCAQEAISPEPQAE